MNGIEGFKTFVKTKPSLISYVNNGEMTWQKFYDMWSLYGEENEVWNKYKPKEDPVSDIVNTTKKSNSLNDVVGMFKNVNVEDLRKGISGLQEALGLLGGMMSTKGSKTNAQTSSTRESYTPRSLFRRFED